MAAIDEELSLPGGRWTNGVVRVGDTVRRPASAGSAFVADLLRHLNDRGFDGCPRYLGQDESGRDIFSYLPGEVAPKWRRFGDDVVTGAAGLLRRLHDATGDFPACAAGQVMCHHDPGPHNTVVRDGRPVAFIDFDFAAPGEALEDVAYLAWSWCISSRPDRLPAAEQARQVRAAADAYGLDGPDRCRLLPAIGARLVRNVEFWQRVSGAERAPSGRRPEPAEIIEWTRRERRFIAANADVFAAALAAA